MAKLIPLLGLIKLVAASPLVARQIGDPMNETILAADQSLAGNFSAPGAPAGRFPVNDRNPYVLKGGYWPETEMLETVPKALQRANHAGLALYHYNDAVPVGDYWQADVGDRNQMRVKIEWVRRPTWGHTTYGDTIQVLEVLNDLFTNERVQNNWVSLSRHQSRIVVADSRTPFERRLMIISVTEADSIEQIEIPISVKKTSISGYLYPKQHLDCRYISALFGYVINRETDAYPGHAHVGDEVEEYQHGDAMIQMEFLELPSDVMRISQPGDWLNELRAIRRYLLTTKERCATASIQVFWNDNDRQVPVAKIALSDISHNYRQNVIDLGIFNDTSPSSPMNSTAPFTAPGSSKRPDTKKFPQTS